MNTLFLQNRSPVGYLNRSTEQLYHFIWSNDWHFLVRKCITSLPIPIYLESKTNLDPVLQQTCELRTWFGSKLWVPRRQFRQVIAKVIILNEFFHHFQKLCAFIAWKSRICWFLSFFHGDRCRQTSESKVDSLPTKI